MGFLNLSKSKAADEVSPVEAQPQVTFNLEKGVNSNTTSEKADDEESLSSSAQAGVKAVEAAAIVWTKYHLIGAYVM